MSSNVIDKNIVIAKALGVYKEPKWKVISSRTRGLRQYPDFRGTEEECNKHVLRHAYYSHRHTSIVQSKHVVTDYYDPKNVPKLMKLILMQSWHFAFFTYVEKCIEKENSPNTSACINLMFHFSDDVTMITKMLYSYINNDKKLITWNKTNEIK